MTTSGFANPLENSKSAPKSSVEKGEKEEEEETEGMRKRQVVLKRQELPATTAGGPNSTNSTASSVVVRSVRYGECQKNHAASVGGYVVDGCREFLASGEEGTNGALTCAACGCHRNFHRREIETEVVSECSSSS